MDNVKNAHFSGSWYPANDNDVRQQLHKWETKLTEFDENIISGVVPHAGWFFSGMMAYDVIRRIAADTEVLIVLGGHLPENYPCLYPQEEFLDTPCGRLSVAGDFMELIAASGESKIDNSADNTIEVQLPIIKSLYSSLSIVPVRVPSGNSALELIERLYNFAAKKNIKTAVIGSTDLTHYGPNYGYTPKDSISDPLMWVEKSDRTILKAMTELNAEKILLLAKNTQCACSAGAAAGAAFFASLNGVEKGRLLQYDTSFSKHEAESFVGYGTVVYEI